MTARPDPCYLCAKPVVAPVLTPAGNTFKVRPEGEPPVCLVCCEQLGRVPWWLR